MDGSGPMNGYGRLSIFVHFGPLVSIFVHKSSYCWKEIMRILLFVCFFIVPCSLFALPSNYPLQMRKAQAYLENQQFSQALALYQDLLQDSTMPWQRAILMYDIGTVFLEQGEWDKAAETFKAVSYDHELAPLLKYRVMHNMIATHAKRGLALKQKDPEAALKWVILAEKELSLLNPIYCDLEKAIGATECQPSEELISLKTILQQQIASIKQEIGAQRIHNANVPAALQYLLESTKQAVEYVGFLNKIPGHHADLMNLYLNLFLDRLNKINPLWENTKTKIRGNSHDPQSQERLQLFQEANAQFKYGLEALSSHDIAMSKTFLEKAYEILNKLLTMPPPPAERKEEPSEELKEPMQQKEQAAAKNIEELLLQIYQEDQLPMPKPQSPEKKELQPW